MGDWKCASRCGKFCAAARSPQGQLTSRIPPDPHVSVWIAGLGSLGLLDLSLSSIEQGEEHGIMRHA
jgi:hypothetical protein